VAFYRRWSSLAAEIALTSMDTRQRGRCATSANFWSRIADAIEAGDRTQIDQLTHNLLLWRDAPTL